MIFQLVGFSRKLVPSRKAGFYFLFIPHLLVFVGVSSPLSTNITKGAPVFTMIRFVAAFFWGLLVINTAAFTPRSSRASRRDITMMAGRKENRKAGWASKKGQIVVQGFVVPPDAKCVDDVVTTQGSAGTKLKVAAELREMGMPLPLVLKKELTDEERAAKLQLRQNLKYGNLALITFFMYQLASTAVVS